jgi:phosphonatase-like hydrolase
MKISMIVFDMAGTTIDENNIVYKTLQTAINHFGVTVDLDTVLAIGAGKEKLNAITDIVKACGKTSDLENTTAMFTYFLDSLSLAYQNYDIQPMKGAENVLLSLRNKNILVVLNTGYDKQTANFILDKIQWKQSYHFDLLVTATDVQQARPAPDMITYAMNLFSIHDGRKIVKVGDSKIDIEEGKNAKCLYSIGVTTGAQTKTQLLEAAPDFIIDDLNDLFTILNLN